MSCDVDNPPNKQQYFKSILLYSKFWSTKIHVQHFERDNSISIVLTKNSVAKFVILKGYACDET